MVIGSPIAHSLSPVLHEAGYRAAGLGDWSYESAEVTAGQVPSFLAGLPSDVRGLSVTMPCKEAALAAADEASALAREVGGANTLVRRSGRWFADNTDVAGVLRALLDAGCTAASSAVVLGSGTTARSVVAALAELGVTSVTFVVRERARPETVALARAHGMEVAVLRENAPETVRAVGLALLVVSTTPMRAADELAERLVAAPSLRIGPAAGPYLLDVVYADWPTRLARVMAERGARVISGIEMLVHQAGVQFELFTGRAAPIADMLEAGRRSVK